MVVEGDGGGEFGDEGECFIEGGSKVVRVGDGIEMVDSAPGSVEVISGGFEGGERVFKGRFGWGGGFDGLDVFFARFDGAGDGFFDVIRGEGRPLDMKIGGEEWIAHGGRMSRRLLGGKDEERELGGD